MQSSYSIDTTDIDQQVIDAVDPETHEVRLRVGPTLYGASKNYEAWKGVSWTVRGTVAEILDLREALKVFFAVCERLGARGARKILDEAA